MRGIRFCVIMGGALMVAGCAQGSLSDGFADSTVDSHSPKAALAESAAPVPAVPAKPVATPVTYLSPAAPTVSAPSPSQMIGMEAEALRAMFGDPTVVRDEPPAQMWQYRAGNCVADLYLYNNGSHYRVTYVETRDTAARAIPADRCLNAVIAARNQPRIAS